MNVVVAEGELLAGIRRVMSPTEAAWIVKVKRKGIANPEAVLADLKADIAARERALGVRR